MCKPERRTDHEVELVFVDRQKGANVPRAEALQYVAGYASAWTSRFGIRGAKLPQSPDGYSVLGPWLVTADEIPDPGHLDLRLAVNGELRQQSNTRFMILGVAELVELASSFYTLYPGDVVFTGTPEGVSAIAPGDWITATVERIGTMEVEVRAAEAAAPHALKSMA